MVVLGLFVSNVEYFRSELNLYEREGTHEICQKKKKKKREKKKKKKRKRKSKTRNSLNIKYKVKLATLVEGDPEVPFSIATTPRCGEGRYSFPWVASLHLFNGECKAASSTIYESLV